MQEDLRDDGLSLNVIDQVIKVSLVKKSLDMNKCSEAPIVRQSTKSLQKFKSFPLEDRIQLLNSEILGKSKVTPKPTSNRPSIIKSTKPTQEEMMNKITSLQNELKKKLGEDGILRNFFKTLNSSKISHIDIYLQLRKIEGIIEPLQQRLQQQNEKAKEYLEEVKRLEEIGAERDISHTKDIVHLQNQIAEMEDTHKKQTKAMKKQLETYQIEHQANQLLVAELKKKNDFLQQENKKLSKLYQESQRQIQRSRSKQKFFSQDINELNEKLQKVNRQLKSQCQKNAELATQNESLYASKTFYQNIKQLYEQSQDKIRQLSKIHQEIKIKQAEINNMQIFCQQKNEIIRIQSSKLLTLQQALEQKGKESKEQISKANKASNQLKEKISNLQQKLETNQKAKQDVQNECKLLKDQLQKEKLKHQEEKFLLLTNQNKVRFQQDDLMSAVKKYQSQKVGQQRIVQRLENKVTELTHKNQLLNKKYKELQKQLDYFKLCEKINQKVYYENYKAAGRILEINKQMAQMLKVQMEKNVYNQEESSQSLDMATSSLANLSSKIICQVKRLLQMIEMGNKKVETRFKEVINILNYLKKATSLENIEQNIDKYIKLIQTEMQGRCEEGSQAYYSLIKRFKSAQNAKKNIIEDSLNTVQDSLQSLKQIRKMQQINKENLDFNQQGKPSFEQSQKYTSQFQKKNEINRQGIHNNVFRRPTTNNRDEIQRKYFRG